MNRFSAWLVLCVGLTAQSALAQDPVAFDDFDLGDPWFVGTGVSDFDPAENIISRTFTPNLEGSTNSGVDRPGLVQGGGFFDWFGIFRRDPNLNGVPATSDGSEEAPFDAFDDSLPGGPDPFLGDDVGFLRSDAGLTGGAFFILDDDPFSPAPFGQAEWVFDVAGSENFTLAVDVAGLGNFEDDDFLDFDISLDGGATYQPALQFRANEDATRIYSQLESGNDVMLFNGFSDPEINASQDGVDDPLESVLGSSAGTQLDVAYQNFMSDLFPGAALNDELYVRMRTSVTASTEYLSFDNVEVFAESTPSGVIPEPSSVALLGFGAVGLVVSRRRKN